MITVNAIDYVDIAKYTIDIYYIDDDYTVDNDFVYLSTRVSCTQFSNNILTEKRDWLTFYFIYHNSHVSFHP